MLCFLIVLSLVFSDLPAAQEDADPRAEMLRGLDTSAFLVVDKQMLTLSLVDSGGVVAKTWPVACAMNYGAKQRKGDHKTPEGVFHICQLLNSSDLTHDFKDGKGKIPGAYGPWFLRLDVPGYIDIGIHGTHLPGSVGTRATEGCVRMRNEDILELKSLVHVGMPVAILPDPVPGGDMPLPDTLASNIFERYFISPGPDAAGPDSVYLAEAAAEVDPEAVGDASEAGSGRRFHLLLWLVAAAGIAAAAFAVFGFFSPNNRK